MVTTPPQGGPGEPIIRFDDVTKTFNGGETHAVDHVSLEIGHGEIFGVIGYSGAGKSTLVRLINALERLDSGTIEVDGRVVSAAGERELRQIRTDIGMIFQQFNLFSARNVASNIGYPLRLAGWSKQKRRERVTELLDFVGIRDKATQYPSQLSGGQKQRVGIARALATSPSILLADEATSALDPETTHDVLDLLLRVNRELGVTIVIITHEMSVVQYACDRVAVMEHGRLVESGDVYQVFAEPRHYATRRFIQTALHDRLDPEAIDRLRAGHPGRMVIASLREGSQGSLDLTAAGEGLGVSIEVLYGGITEVGHRPFGSLTLGIDGPHDAVGQTIGRLETQASVIDLGTAAAPLADPRWESREPAAGTLGPADDEEDVELDRTIARDETTGDER